MLSLTDFRWIHDRSQTAIEILFRFQNNVEKITNNEVATWLLGTFDLFAKPDDLESAISKMETYKIWLQGESQTSEAKILKTIIPNDSIDRLVFSYF